MNTRYSLKLNKGGRKYRVGIRQVELKLLIVFSENL